MMKYFLGIVVVIQLLGSPQVVSAQTEPAATGTTKTPCEEWADVASEDYGVCTDLIEGIPCAVLEGGCEENITCASDGVGSKRNADGVIMPGTDICYAVITKSGIGGIQSYVAMVYRYASWAIVTLAVLMLIISGIQMSVGGAVPDKVAEARKRIFQIIGGLVLFFLIGVILRTINPTFFT